MLKQRGFFYRSEQSSSTLEKIAFPWVKIAVLVAALLFLFAGCSPAVRYVESVRVDTVRVVPPVIERELPAQIVTDTVVIGNEIVRTDTVVTVKYFPKEQRFYVKVKPDTVEVLRIDTVTQVQIRDAEQDEESWWELWWVWAIALAAVLIIWIKRK